MMSHYSIHKNGQCVAIIEADDYSLDFTGKEPVLVFQRAGKRARVRGGKDRYTPYWEDQKPKRGKKKGKESTE
jgi:hypothetical protein